MIPSFLVGETGKTSAQLTLEEKKSTIASCFSREEISGGIPSMAEQVIIVMSDSHGDRQIVEEIKNHYKGKVDAIFSQRGF